MLHLIFYSPHVLAENQLPRTHQSFLMNSLLLRLPSNIIIGSTVGPTVSTSAATTETSNEKSNMHSRDNQIQICQPFTVVSSVSNKIHISFNLKVDRSAGHIIIYLLAVVSSTTTLSVIKFRTKTHSSTLEWRAVHIIMNNNLKSNRIFASALPLHHSCDIIWDTDVRVSSFQPPCRFLQPI